MRVVKDDCKSSPPRSKFQPANADGVGMHQSVLCKLLVADDDWHAGCNYLLEVMLNVKSL